MVELILVLVVVWHKLVVEWELVVVVKEIGYYIAPAFDILLTAADMNLKK
jgi:hypothetical protein